VPRRPPQVAEGHLLRGGGLGDHGRQRSPRGGDARRPARVRRHVTPWSSVPRGVGISPSMAGRGRLTSVPPFLRPFPALADPTADPINRRMRSASGKGRANRSSRARGRSGPGRPASFRLRFRSLKRSRACSALRGLSASCSRRSCTAVTSPSVCATSSTPPAAARPPERLRGSRWGPPPAAGPSRPRSDGGLGLLGDLQAHPELRSLGGARLQAVHDVAQSFARILVEGRRLFRFRRSFCEVRRRKGFAASPIAHGVEGVYGDEKPLVYALSLFLASRMPRRT
jgi:hypothetical protein